MASRPSFVISVVISNKNFLADASLASLISGLMIPTDMAIFVGNESRIASTNTPPYLQNLYCAAE